MHLSSKALRSTNKSGTAFEASNTTKNLDLHRGQL